MIIEQLASGLTVWLDPMRDVRSVALGVFVAHGSATEEPAGHGATHFLEHLLFRRSRRRTGAAIARLIDRLGGDCDAYTTKESVAFHARTAAARLHEATSLILDLASAPAFTLRDVEIERQVILEEIAEAGDIPEDRLHETFAQTIFSGNPLARPILGTPDEVKQLSLEKIQERFFGSFWPEKMLFAAAGAFDPKVLIKKLNGFHPNSGSKKASCRENEIQKPVPEPCRFEVARPDISQTHLLFGIPAFSQTDPALPAGWLISTILGGGVSSRLWREVRDRKGLAYHIGTSQNLYRSSGLFFVEAATAPARLPRLLSTLGRVLREFRDEGMRKDELRKAKDQVRAELELSLESTAARREGAARDWMYRGRPYEVDEIVADIEAVSEAETGKLAQELFGDPERFGLGISGPPAGTGVFDELLKELSR